jgi:D-arabinose 1-dehydrogenase-like Zn-dependent alcohol dehydrogenase
MGFSTFAVGRGKDKEELVMKLGARRYIDSRSENAVEEPTKFGGVLGGLAVNGKLIVIGASNEPLEELYLRLGIDLEAFSREMCFSIIRSSP